MARRLTAGVSSEVLNRLFDEFNIWAKIHDGRLTSKPLGGIPSRTWPNATSFIIKHFIPDGKHIATTHCIKDDNGHIYHWDAKDFRLHEVCLWRV